MNANKPSRTTRRLLFILPIVAGLGLVACAPPQEGTNLELDALKAKKDSLENQLAEVEAQIALVDTAKVKIYPKVSFHKTSPVSFEHYFAAQGAIESDENVVLTPETGGIITKMHVHEGQSVSKGQTIANFDAAIIAANIKELDEQIELAEYAADKQRKLFEKGLTTEIAKRQAESQLESLLKTKQTLKTQQGKTAMRAPFAGIIEEVFANEGETGAPGMPIVRLVGKSDPYVTAEVSEIYLGKLNKGILANVSFSALGDEYSVDSVEVAKVGGYVNPANRTLKVRVNLPENDKYIPNLVATIKIRDYMKDSAIVVPSGTITQDAEGFDIVFVGKKSGKEDFELSSQRVIVGATYGGMTEVVEGLTWNQLVVDKGSHSAYSGLKVRELDK